MGKHSHNKGLYGPDGKGHSGPRPAKRRVPSAAAGKRPVPAQTSRMMSEPSDDRYSLSDPAKRKRGALEAAPERLRAERDRRRSRTKRALAIVAGALGVLIVAGSVGVYAYAKHIETTMQRTVFQQEKIAVELEPAKPQKPYNMLILGFDKRPKEKAFRSDTMILGARRSQDQGGLAHLDPARHARGDTGPRPQQDQRRLLLRQGTAGDRHGREADRSEDQLLHGRQLHRVPADRERDGRRMDQGARRDQRHPRRIRAGATSTPTSTPATSGWTGTTPSPS